MSSIIDNILEKNGIKELHPLVLDSNYGDTLYAYIHGNRIEFCNKEFERVAWEDLKLYQKDVILSVKDDKWIISESSSTTMSYWINDKNEIIASFIEGYVKIGFRKDTYIIPRSNILKLQLENEAICVTRLFDDLKEEILDVYNHISEYAIRDSEIEKKYTVWIEIEEETLYLGISINKEESKCDEIYDFFFTDVVLQDCICVTKSYLYEIDEYLGSCLIIHPDNTSPYILHYTENHGSEGCFVIITSEGLVNYYGCCSSSKFVRYSNNGWGYSEDNEHSRFSLSDSNGFILLVSEYELAIVENMEVYFFRFDKSSDNFIDYNNGFAEIKHYMYGTTKYTEVYGIDGSYGRKYGYNSYVVICKEGEGVIYSPEEIQENSRHQIGTYGLINVKTGEYIVPCLYQRISFSVESENVASMVSLIYKNGEEYADLNGLYINSELVVPIANHVVVPITYIDRNDRQIFSNYILEETAWNYTLYYNGIELLSEKQKIQVRIPYVNDYDNRKMYMSDCLIVENINGAKSLIEFDKIIGTNYKKIVTKKIEQDVFFIFGNEEYFEGVYENKKTWIVPEGNKIRHIIGKWIVYDDFENDNVVLIDFKGSILAEALIAHYLDYDSKNGVMAYLFENQLVILPRYGSEPLFFESPEGVISGYGFLFDSDNGCFVQNDDDCEEDVEEMYVEYDDDTDWERESWIALGGDPDKYNGSIDDLMDAKGY